mmetsp:Transcript_6196/g.5609  ORF Transcript_6196/g.5609 Transcript_6196/m.5609 type:complete len:237 (+) Transcript_6196:269-979(+)
MASSTSSTPEMPNKLSNMLNTKSSEESISVSCSRETSVRSLLRPTFTSRTLTPLSTLRNSTSSLVKLVPLSQPRLPLTQKATVLDMDMFNTKSSKMPKVPEKSSKVLSLRSKTLSSTSSSPRTKELPTLKRRTFTSRTYLPTNKTWKSGLRLPSANSEISKRSFARSIKLKISGLPSFASRAKNLPTRPSKTSNKTPRLKAVTPSPSMSDGTKERPRDKESSRETTKKSPTTPISS